MDTLEDYEGLVGGGYLDASDKLNECRFFLRLMEQTVEWNEFRWLTSAFLSASRAIIDWLASSAHYAIPGAGQWEMDRDEEAIAILNKHFVTKHEAKSGKIYAHSPRDPLFQKLCGDRNENAHNGPSWIKPEHVTNPREFKFGWDEIAVIDFAAKVLDRLITIQLELRPDRNKYRGS